MGMWNLSFELWLVILKHFMDQTCIVFSPENTSLCFWYVAHFNKGIFLKNDISSVSTFSTFWKSDKIKNSFWTSQK